jgi:hypothetical protein
VAAGDKIASEKLHKSRREAKKAALKNVQTKG